MSVRTIPSTVRHTPGSWACAGIAALLVACGGGGSNPGGGAPPAAAPPVASDTTAPTVLSSLPADNASSVLASAAIAVTFSEAMDAASLNAATFTLSAGGVAVPGSVSASGGAGASTATFTPAAALAAGTQYTAVISSGAKDVAGNTLVGPYSWHFITEAAPVVARVWSTPVLLEGADGQARTPAVSATLDSAPNNTAQATAVWIQFDGARDSVYANRYQGGVWQAAQRVEDADIDATDPRVAMGTLGRAVMAWGQGFNGVYTVWGNVYDPIPPLAAQPLSFASAFAHQLSAGGNANSPQVAFDAAGYDSYSAWTQYVPDRLPASYRPATQQYLFVPCDLIIACAWTEGDFGWRPPSTLLEISGEAGSAPQVVGLGGGKAVAAWFKYQAGLWASSYTKAGGWATAVQVTATAAKFETLSLAANAGDDLVAVWIDDSGQRATLVASRRVGTAWSAPVALDDPAGGASDAPRVVLDAQGNALVAWLQGGRVLARRCAAGTLAGCATAQVVLSAATATAEAPRLAGAPNGDAVVAWKQAATSSGSAPGVHAIRYSASSTGWDAAATRVGDGTRFNEAPNVAMDKGGHATLVWTRDEGGKSNIYASRLE